MPGQHVIHLVMMVTHVVGHCWPCIVTWQQMVWDQLLMRRPLPRYTIFLAVIILCLSHCFRHLIISKKQWAKLVNVGDTSISWDNLNLTSKKTSSVLLQWKELLKIWSTLLSNWPNHHILSPCHLVQGSWNLWLLVLWSNHWSFLHLSPQFFLHLSYWSFLHLGSQAHHHQQAPHQCCWAQWQALYCRFFTGTTTSFLTSKSFAYVTWYRDVGVFFCSSCDLSCT